MTITVSGREFRAPINKLVRSFTITSLDNEGSFRALWLIEQNCTLTAIELDTDRYEDTISLYRGVYYRFFPQIFPVSVEPSSSGCHMIDYVEIDLTSDFADWNTDTNYVWTKEDSLSHLNENQLNQFYIDFYFDDDAQIDN